MRKHLIGRKLAVDYVEEVRTPVTLHVALRESYRHGVGMDLTPWDVEGCQELGLQVVGKCGIGSMKPIWQLSSSSLTRNLIQSIIRSLFADVFMT